MANESRTSAQIIRFPAGGRAGLAQQREQAMADPAASRYAKVASGGAWYHEEAVKQADDAR